MNKEDLQLELIKKKIYVPENIKASNTVLTKLLGDHYIKEHREELTFGTCYVQALENFMLCKHLKDEMNCFDDNTNPITSPDWIAELKKDDFRTMIVYDPEYGFEMFSRRESVKTFLNNKFTDKIFFIKNGLVRKPADFKNTFNYRFVLDCGITASSDNTEFEGISYSNAEDLLQAILGSGAERALEYQLNGNSLIFTGFDVLYFEENPQSIAKEDLPKFIYEESELSKDDVEWIQHNF